MLPAEYDTLRANEDTHWWYRVLHHQVTTVLRQRLASNANLLDAGCGTGGMLTCLHQHFPALNSTGVDDSPFAINHCKARGLTTVRKATVNNLPFTANTFDAVLSLDVLYHRDVNPESAMREMVRVLKPDGMLILNLPAFQCLAGSHDQAVGGARRYNFSDVRSLLHQQHLHLALIHYWNAWLFFPLLIWRLFSRSCPPASTPARSDLIPLAPKLNRCFTRLGSLDAALCGQWHIPFGSSIFVVATKPTVAREH
jgi:SAM-dependent methyltransferase